MAELIVSEKALRENYQLLRREMGVPVIPVLKANAYGLGADKLFEIYKEEGASLIAVSLPEEAAPLCGRGVEILVLSCVRTRAYAEFALDHGVTAAVDTAEFAALLSELAAARGIRARVHIKIDTGMGRFGFTPDQTDEIAGVFNLPGLEVTGIFSHCYNAFGNGENNREQLRLFTGVCDALASKGIALPARHLANSCAAIRDPALRLDAVRIGSALGGRIPIRTELGLQKVGRLEGEILSIRTLPAGSNLGYGGVFRLKRETRVAVVSVGTAHGLQRETAPGIYRFLDICRYLKHDLELFFRKPAVYGTVNGRSARMLGRPATTHSFFDVTGVPCAEGDRMVLDVLPMRVDAAVERIYE